MFSAGLVEPPKAGEDIKWLVLLFKKIQLETLTEFFSHCPHIAKPVSHAAKRNLQNFEGVTLKLSEAKEPWCLLPVEASLRTTEV